MNPSRTYEPEIDGLRALAVMVVVLYHAGFKGFDGGFVGVDIFFVISGYLISRNILSDITAGTFTFRDFYLRRARRIFPAMFATMLLCAIAGFFIFSPLDLERLGASIVYASAALPNIFFWQESGYWDTSKQFKPLLHFWSLGVEEQFYFVWPFLLLWLHRKIPPNDGNRILFRFILGLSVISLLLSQYVLTKDSTAAFYLTPFRMFEFGIGAMLIWANPFFDRFSNRVKEALLLFALTAIILSVRKYSETMAFPGFTALVPTLAVAVIIGARKARFTGMLLRNRAAVSIGLISYSLYLIHWPILVFANYYSLEDFSKLETAGLVLVSVAMAYGMYHFIEQPFRKPASGPAFLFKPAHFSLLMGFLVIALAVPSALTWKNEGWSGGKSRELAVISRNVQMGLAERQQYLLDCLRARGGHCKRNDTKKNYIILGDSYGEDVGIALFNAYPDYKFSFQTAGGCKALLDAAEDQKHPPARERCKSLQEKIFRNERDWSKYDAVLLSMAWDDKDPPRIAPTIDYLKTHGAKRVIVVGPKVRLKVFTSEILARSTGFEDFVTLVQREMDVMSAMKLKEMIAASTHKEGAEFFDITEAQCPGKTCTVLIPGTLEPVIWDNGHWSVAGSKYIGSIIKSYFDL
jgi:peptidoglycan/LPS O-acetylase OafA/YrhL